MAVKKLNIDPKKYPKLELPRALLMEFKRMKDLQHDHITRFVFSVYLFYLRKKIEQRLLSVF